MDRTNPSRPGRRVGHPAFLPVFLFALLLPAVVQAVPATDPAQVVPSLPRDRLLEITLADGTVVTGMLLGARTDSLLVDPGDGAPAEALAVGEIVRIRERRSNAGRGAGWGGISGAMVGGGLGLLSGLYLASVNDPDAGDAGPVLLGTAAGAVAGAAVFGIIGWGIGSVSDSWRDLYGTEPAARGDRAGEGSSPTRLGLAAGTGAIEIRDERFAGFAWRAGLSKPISPHLEMGPHFEYVHLGGSVVRPGDGGTAAYVATDDLFHASLGVKVHARRSGFGPYAAVGAGWYWGNGGYLGGHAGGGLRYLNHGGTDVNLDARWHFNITEIDRGADAGFLTVTLGIAFDL